MKKIKKLLCEMNADEYLGLCIGIIMIVIGSFLISKSLVMNDAYWHIKCGENILKTFPNITIYNSWVYPNKKWTAHEWLFDIIIYKISSISMNLMVLTFVIIYVITIALIIYFSGIASKNKDIPVFYTCIVFGIQIISMSLAASARPQAYSNLFLVLTIVILVKSLKNEKLLFITIPLTILWSNIHGGTVNIIYFLTFVFIVCNSFNLDVGKIQFKRAPKKWLITSVVVFISQLLAICINPFGLDMLLYPYENMADKLMVQNVVEWAAPDAKETYILIMFILPMLLGLVSLIQTEKRIHSYDIAIYFMFIILFMRSIRFFSYLAIAQTLLIYKYAFQFNIIKMSKIKNNKLKILDNISMLIIMTCCVLLSILVILNTDYSKIKGNKDISDEMLEVIKDDNPKRLLNHYNTGGYLIYNDIDVFVDSRYEPFKQTGLMDEYYKIYGNLSYSNFNDIEKYFDKYKFDACILQESNAILCKYLYDNDKYTLLFNDGKYLYFSKN